jgi:hypothetical protein
MPTTTRNLSSLGAALKLLLDDNFSMLRSLKLGGSAPTTTRRGSYGSLISGATHYKSTWMMTFANTEDPWIDYLIISRLGGCYTTPIIKFFKTEDSESRLTLS